ncbi:hypothetical protein EXIGLDRAFT_724269 [Exidia glandulosa HHB12029]|uniref:Uncharacterized protein n=1 Tax=Exidia glandulosa HHB12029 TaxID=1314781 RepID=A0A165MT16_EXIGL|nr:hypothetical protein EXIGLDRAFT_724269 [Exidia glandulosa HHB12029]
MDDAISSNSRCGSPEPTNTSSSPEQAAGSPTHFQTVLPELKLQICRLVARRCLPALALAHSSWTSVAQDTLLTSISVTLWHEDNNGRWYADARAAVIRLLCALRDTPEKALRVRSFRVTFNDRDEAIAVTDEDWRLYVDTLKQLHGVRHIRLPFTDPVERLDEVIEMIEERKLALWSIELAGRLYKEGHMADSPFAGRLEAALDALKFDGATRGGSLRVIVAESMEDVAPSWVTRFIPTTGDFVSSMGYNPRYGGLSFYTPTYYSQYWKDVFERSFVVLPHLYDDFRQDVKSVRIFFSPEDFAEGRAGQFTTLIAESFPNVTRITIAFHNYYVFEPDEEAKFGPALLKGDALVPALAPFGSRLQSLTFECYVESAFSYLKHSKLGLNLLAESLALNLCKNLRYLNVAGATATRVGRSYVAHSGWLIDC